MKVHAETIGTRKVEHWYDPSYGWVVALYDAATGYQIGEADYVGHKTALPEALAWARKRAATEVSDD